VKGKRPFAALGQYLRKLQFHGAGFGGRRRNQDIEESVHRNVRSAPCPVQRIDAAQGMVQSGRGFERHPGQRARRDEARHLLQPGKTAGGNASGANLGANARHADGLDLLRQRAAYGQLGIRLDVVRQQLQNRVQLVAALYLELDRVHVGALPGLEMELDNRLQPLLELTAQ
jgi:hypothetical protein